MADLFVLAYFGVIAVLIIYFVIKRIKDKKKEKFEKRNN